MSATADQVMTPEAKQALVASFGRGLQESGLVSGEQLLSVKGVAKKLQMSTGWVYLQVRRQLFPAPIGCGGHSRWLESEVDAWIQRQREARDAAGEQS